MRLVEIEAWAIRVLDSLKRGQPVEDSRVELKAKLGQPNRIARRIAGHANAARGENILWLLGVDEKSKSIAGIDNAEFSTWWSQVTNQFESTSPEVRECCISYDGKMLLALLIYTDRAPFVVKNPAGGAVQFEVPWRSLTGVRSARRAEMLRILEPIQKLPEVEILSARLWADGKLNDIGQYEILLGDQCQWQLRIDVFVIPRCPDLVFPIHCVQAKVTEENSIGLADFEPYFLRSKQNVTREEDFVVPKPSRVKIRADHMQDKLSASSIGSSAHLDLRLIPAGFEKGVSVSCDLMRIKEWSFRFDAT